MMFGGGFMMLLGVLALLMLLALPILLVGLVIAGVWGLQTRRSTATGISPTNFPTYTPPKAVSRSCSSCGTALEADWSHCPRCGAPAE